MGNLGSILAESNAGNFWSLLLENADSYFPGNGVRQRANARRFTDIKRPVIPGDTSAVLLHLKNDSEPDGIMALALIVSLGYSKESLHYTLISTSSLTNP